MKPLQAIRRAATTAHRGRAAALASVCGALALGAAPAQAATPITDCATTAGIRAAVAAGGEYVLQCGVIHTITFAPGEGEIVVDKPVSIDATGFTVYLNGNSPARARRMFRVDSGGSLSLQDISLDGGFAVTAPSPGAGPAGSAGIASGAGANAPAVPPSKGGCVYVGLGGVMSIRSSGVPVSVINCHVRGLDGGAGGGGGTGASGADGANGPDGGGGGSGGSGGTGGGGADGLRGGNGGAGANGADGQGGAIYNAGVLVIRSVAFGSNSAAGGNGGNGGGGGSGGGGGNGGAGGAGDYGTPPTPDNLLGGPGGNGGDGGNGGNGAGAGFGGRSGDGGAGRGGAVYNAGAITIDGSTFQTSQATGGQAGFGAGGGSGGRGGDGGGAGNPGIRGDLNVFVHGAAGGGGAGGTAGDGANGGSGGNWGDGVGGAIYYERAPRAAELPTGTTFGTGPLQNAVAAGALAFPVNRGAGGSGGLEGHAGVPTPCAAPPGQFPDPSLIWCGPCPNINCGAPGLAGVAGINGSPGRATDPDVSASAARPPPELVKGFETDSGATKLTFQVALDAPLAVPVRVEYRTVDGTAGSGPPHDVDFRAASGTLTFTPGETTKTVSVIVNGDTAREPDETFALLLSSPDGAPIADPALTAKIVNDDPVPRLTVADASAARPITGSASAKFQVKLANPTDATVKVDYATADGTAKAGTHYDAKRGTLTFAPRQMTATVAVPIRPDPKELENDDTRFTLKVSNARDATLADAAATGTIAAKRPLEVTLKATPAKVVVKQTEKGATPEKLTITVTARNTGRKPIGQVTLPKKLGIDWAKDSGGKGTVALAQKTAPKDLTLGTLKGGQSASRTYGLQAKGDGDLDVTALVTGRRNAEDISTRGKKNLEIGSQLLVFSAKRSLKFTSEKPGLLKAGSPYLIAVTLQNRSYYRSLLIPGVYANLKGNAADGSARDLAPALLSILRPPGALSEVDASRYLVIKPRQKRSLYVVVRTTASDARQADDGEGGRSAPGGTRSTATFAKPEAATLSKQNQLTRVSRALIVMGKDSDEFVSSLDDSAPPPPKVSEWDAVFWYPRAMLKAELAVTWGAIRGVLWDGPKLLINGALSASTATLGYLNQQVELWAELEADPDLRGQYMNLLVAKTSAVFEEAPFLIADKSAEIYKQVDRAVGAHYKRLADEWEVGNWADAIEEFTTESTEGVANVALMLAPGTLARFPRLAARLNATKAAYFARVLEGVNAAVAGVRTRLPQAIYALSKVIKPGLRYSDELLAKLYGISAEQAAWLKRFADKHKILVTLRSRAQESLKWLDKGAVLKPYWIKLKNVNWTDAQYLGYAEADVGRLIVREPPGWSEVQAKLASQNLKSTDVAWKEVRVRWEQRFNEFRGQERKDMWKWHGKGEVNGKWPWLDNGIDPTVQADEFFPAGFRLKPTGRKGEYAVEIFNPKLGPKGDWASVTGDVDLIALTNADGTALDAAKHVELLKEMRGGPVGAMHPESATWKLFGKWWFKQKEDYLLNADDVTGLPKCCLAQFGADGEARAVKWNKKLSEVIGRTERTYRLWWDGGYIAPPGARAR